SGLGASGVARAAIVIDDLHTLRGTPAEGALERLVECLPPGLVVLAGTRVLPRFNLSRLRVSGDLLDLGADELRFRSWEVEELFRQVYGEPLRPEDFAQLARRTAGWAAGLQLFHLATRGKPIEERTRAVTALANRHGLIHEYLVRNVLDELEPGLRGFVLGAAALGRMSGELCDDLLEASGSARHLEELERRQLFTAAVEPAGWYRFHEVLRSHAEAAFMQDAGEDPARRHRLRAAALLEKAGAWSEALQVYCRAGDWEAAARLVGLQADELVAGPWVELLPEDMLRDSWVLLAAARRHRAAGRVAAAQADYARAERAFGTSSPGLVCRRERLALADWLAGAMYPSSTWSGLLRSALNRDPAVVADQARALGRGTGELAGAVADLLAGRVTDARSGLERLAERWPALSPVNLSARLALGVAATLSGQQVPGPELERLVEDCEDAALPWLAEIARCLVPGSAEGTGSDPEPFGDALRRLLRAWTALAAGRRTDELPEPIVQRLGELAPVAQAWALAVSALGAARASAPGAGERAHRAEQAARAVIAPGPLAIAQLAAGLVGGASAARSHEQGAQLARDLGLTVPGAPGPGALAPADRGAPCPPRVTVNCLGRFAVHVGAEAVDLGLLKPRVRTLLRFLAMQGGRPVHREAIIEALWPDVAPDAATRNLQVAISSLRQVLDGAEARPDASAIRRDGDAYVLADQVSIDVAELASALARGRSRLRHEDPAGAQESFAQAVELYGGELLPEEGPAEWVVAERDRLRVKIAEAAVEAARLALAHGDSGAAVSFCERALAVEPFNDAVWQLLIAAHDAAESPASAARARARYRAVLDDLGVTERLDGVATGTDS
ncbi:MAG TPA: BTAD domain-containing putative transcriptional regulator, partial [Acidimicrobiales bacterium]